MYKKFLVLLSSMLLTVALVGCSPPSSDQQTSDQTDTMPPAQGQGTSPMPTNGVEQMQEAVTPPSAESTPPSPSANTTAPVPPPSFNYGERRG